jgi:hypothetical protein
MPNTPRSVYMLEACAERTIVHARPGPYRALLSGAISQQLTTVCVRILTDGLSGFDVLYSRIVAMGRDQQGQAPGS